MDWKLYGHNQCELLVERVVERYDAMGTQAANVERENKANKFIHTKPRSSLAKQTVDMLIYCYWNLQLCLTRKRLESLMILPAPSLALTMTLMKTTPMRMILMRMSKGQEGRQEEDDGR
jgi:hypothetical protein